MNKLKQLLKISDVRHKIENSILCFKENDNHSFLTRNNEFIYAMVGKNIDLNEREAFNILDKKVIDFFPEAFDGRVYVISSFGGFESSLDRKELDIDNNSFDYLYDKEAEVSLMQIMEDSNLSYVFNVYTKDGIKVYVTDKFGYSSEEEDFIISNRLNIEEVEGYIMLSEERGPISYSKNFADRYMGIADYSDLGLNEKSKKMIYPTLIYISDSKVLDIQILNNFGEYNG